MNGSANPKNRLENPGTFNFEPSRLERFGSAAHRADDNILRSRSSNLVASLASVVEHYSIISPASCFHACFIA